MSYRDERQSLSEPLGKMLDGIKEFDAAVTARIESGAWVESHLNEIHDLSVRLMSLRVELSKLRRANW